MRSLTIFLACAAVAALLFWGLVWRREIDVAPGVEPVAVAVTEEVGRLPPVDAPKLVQGASARGGGGDLGEGVAALLESSSNLRALVHAMLSNGDRRSIVVAVGAINFCAGVQGDGSGFTADQLAMLPPAMAKRWHARVASCGAAGGIDAQQMRAVSAAVKDKYPEVAALNGPLQGSEAERAAIDSMRSAYAAARWIDKKVEKGELVFALPSGAPAAIRFSSLAVQVESCELAACDSLLAVVLPCVTQGLCTEATLAGQTELAMRKDEHMAMADWAALRGQARDALRQFFPRMTSARS